MIRVPLSPAASELGKGEEGSDRLSTERLRAHFAAVEGLPVVPPWPQQSLLHGGVGSRLASLCRALPTVPWAGSGVLRHSKSRGSVQRGLRRCLPGAAEHSLRGLCLLCR